MPCCVRRYRAAAEGCRSTKTMNIILYVLAGLLAMAGVFIILFPSHVRRFVLWISIFGFYNSRSTETWMRKCSNNAIRAIAFAYLLMYFSYFFIIIFMENK